MSQSTNLGILKFKKLMVTEFSIHQLRSYVRHQHLQVYEFCERQLLFLRMKTFFLKFLYKYIFYFIWVFFLSVKKIFNKT